MSLFALLYSSVDAVPENALLRAFPEATRATFFKTGEIAVTASLVSKPHFLDEEFGIDPSTQLYFTLDKSRTVEARRTLAAAVRRYLGSSDGDVVVMYLDVPVVKRVGDQRFVAAGYDDLVPDSDSWTRTT